MPIALVTYDYETTGPEPKIDLPVQTAATLSIDGGKHLPIVHAISDPKRKIHPEAIETHGIHDHMVKGYPEPAIIVQMMGEYVDNLDYHGYTVIIAGHNTITFDNTISERLGWNISKYLQLDTFRLARRHNPTAENHKLGDTYETLFGEVLEGCHDAMADVLGVTRVIDKYCEIYQMDHLELAEYCSKPEPMSVIPFGKHKGKPFKDLPNGWVKFMVTKTQIIHEDADFRESVKTHFRYLYDAHYSR